VIYSSLDRAYAETVVKASGIAGVQVISDTEAAKSSGLVNRLLVERERPVADIFLSGDPMRTAFLESQGIGDSFQSREVAVRFRMLLINTEREQGSERPHKTLDLAKPEFAPYSCLANPQFGTTSVHIAVLLLTYGEERTRQFLNDFIANGGTLVASNGEVKRRVGSGEFTYGITDSDDVSVALRDGKPVEYEISDLESFGAIQIPVTAVVLKNAPHPDVAEELADYLTSEAMERVMSEGMASHFSLLQPDQKPSAFDFSYSEVSRVARLDYHALSEVLAKFQPWLDAWVAENR